MTDTTTHDVESLALKRVRILDQKQSKYGCRTCKQRKIKCDEKLPACLRCSRSGRVCTGYDRISYRSLDSHQQRLTIVDAVGAPPWHQPEQQAMAQLALALFSHDPHQLHSETRAEVLSVLLPQLVATRPYVNAAAGALGVAYDRYILHRTQLRDNRLLTSLYLNALGQVRIELQRPEPEVVPLLLAAMLLAAAESIQAKQKDALSHLLGAFSMISLLTAASLKPRCATSSGSLTRNCGIIEGLGSIQDVFHSVDYHISMFAWGRCPQFPPLPVTSQMLYPASIDDLTTGHPALQQWGLHFIATAMEPAWEERIDFPPALIVQQDHLIAWLNRWLRTYTLLLETPSSRPSPLRTPHFRILKAQTLSSFIAVSNIKPPSQVTYDTYAPEFEEIIRCAEYVLTPDNPITSVPPRPLLPYSPFPGIIHPLFFTARKYRHCVSRRRAIHLLRHAGIEGPFQGDFEARVAARIVEIEENRRPFKPFLAPADMLPQSEIADRNRVYMCWILEPPDQKVNKQQMGEITGRVIKFSRRRKLAPVSRATQVDRQPSEIDAAEGDMWEIWEETVEGP